MCKYVYMYANVVDFSFIVTVSVGRSTCRAVAVIIVQVKNNDSKQERANLVGLAISAIAFGKVGSSAILNTTMLAVVVLVFIAVLVVAD